MKNIPFYEIYYANIQNPKLIDIITYKLYKYNYFHIFNKLIYILDKFKFKNKHISDKIIEDQPIKNLNILTQSGFNRVENIYRTKPFYVYKLLLDNNDFLYGADNHLVYTNLGWQYIKDLNKDIEVYTNNGFIKVKKVIKTNNKQYLCDLSIDNETHSYYSNNILSHNTTTVIAHFVWYILFHADRQIVITANKERTTKEILKKSMDVFKALPYFLKPGIEEYSKTTLRIENGSSIRAVATTGDSATGDSVNILLIDECALIPLNVMREFWASVFPTLSSFSQSLIVVMSTPRGRSGLFYDIYTGALAGTNGFVYKRVDWYQVPGHDEEWMQKQIQAFGLDLWDREFGLSFDTNESRILQPEEYKYIEENKKKFVNVEIYGIPKKVNEKIFWDPDFHPDELTYNDLFKRRFVIIIDTAEGTEAGEAGKKDSDYNIINIFEMVLLDPDTIQKNRLGYKAVKYTNCILLRQVGIYIDNYFDEEECAAAALHIVFDIFKNGQGSEGEIDNTRILLELNFNGKNFKNIFKKHDMYYETILNGFKTVGGNHGKKYFCELGAKLISLHQIIPVQDHEIPVMSTIEQLKTFGKVGNSYAGLDSHDDIAITVLFASRFFDNEIYFEWLDEWFTLLPQIVYDEEEAGKLMNILHFLEIYEYSKDDEEDDDEGMLNYTVSGFGEITTETTGTYGSLMRQTEQLQQYPFNVSLSFNNNRRFNNNMMQVRR